MGLAEFQAMAIEAIIITGQRCLQGRDLSHLMRAMACRAGGGIGTFHGKGMVWLCRKLVIGVARPACTGGLLDEFIS
jgi:hypothetical protein